MYRLRKLTRLFTTGPTTMILFTPNHEWIRVCSNRKVGLMGITHYAQQQLGDIVFVDLPMINTETQMGEVIASVESVKSTSDMHAAVSGIVIDTNETLSHTPETMNTAAETDGWMLRLELTDSGELSQLMEEHEYSEYLSTLDV